MSNNETEFKAVDVDVEDWIGGTSFLQADHTIYRNPAMWREYQPVLDKIDELEQQIEDLTAPDEDAVTPERALSGEESLTPAPVGDRALGEAPAEAPRVAELRAERDKLVTQANEMYEQYAADVEVWRLRKLEEDEMVALREAIGEPPTEPNPPSKNARPQAITLYTRRYDAHLRAMADYVVKYNVRAVVAATLGVTVRGVDRGTVTVDQVERMLTRPGGKQHVTELYDVIEKLSLEGVDMVAPHRPGA